MTIVLSPQRDMTPTPLPRHSCFLPGSTGGRCPQAPFGTYLQQTAIQDIPLPSEPLAGSPSTWEVPDSSVLAKMFRISHKPCVSLLACYSQSWRNKLLSLPWGTGADLPCVPRSSSTLEICCHPTCLCTLTPCNPPGEGSFLQK